jgi:hypothetical protein
MGQFKDLDALFTHISKIEFNDWGDGDSLTSADGYELRFAHKWNTHADAKNMHIASSVQVLKEGQYVLRWDLLFDYDLRVAREWWFKLKNKAQVRNMEEGDAKRNQLRTEFENL